MSVTIVKGFEVRTDRLYDLRHHTWVVVSEGPRARIGMDALGLETSGTLAHLSMVAVGSEIAAGEPFGSLEAEKYVGPLVSPLSGRVLAVNIDVLDNAGLVQADPYDRGWMIELEATDLEEESAALIAGEAAIVAAFEQKVTEYRLEGVLAE